MNAMAVGSAVRSAALWLRPRRIRVLSPHAEPLVYLCDVGSGGAGRRIASPTLQSRQGQSRCSALRHSRRSAQALSIGSAPHRRTGPLSALAPPPAVAPDRHIARYTPLPPP